MRKTKIVCTLGPNENDYELMKKLAEKMDVARFNFSHGSHQEHLGRLALLKQARKDTGREIAALLDTKGPEIRTGELEDHKKVMLEAGNEIVLTIDECVGNASRVYINYNGLNEDVQEGSTILIDDGLIGLKVQRVEGADIHCLITNGGELGEKKGVNVPNVSIRLPGLTEKDIEDIKFGIEEGFDFVAASFVRNADTIEQIRALIDEAGSSMKIIAKIESQEGLDNLDAIIAAADGIMVARGDLGVEIDAKRLPQLQKEMIHKCNFAGKLVITATQMLESMITNLRPTRAEITDVANAIYDGTSAIMLSGETAAGKHPVEAVKTMALIAETTEKDINYIARLSKRPMQKGIDSTNAIAHAAVTTAHDLGAKAVITVTKSGSTAKNISKYRPTCMIIGCTPDDTVHRQMSLSWGVVPVKMDEKSSTDELFSAAIDAAKSHGLVEKDDIVVITAGIPLGVAGKTNMLKVDTIK